MTTRRAPRALPVSQPLSVILAAKLYRTIVKSLRFARFYDSRNETYGSIVSQLIGSSLRPDQIVLDLGCGPGGITSKLLGPYAVIGADLDRYPLLNFFDPGIPRVQAQSQRLPFKKESIDVIVAISLVEHLSDQRAFFQEMERVLKRGGRGILQVPELRYPIEPHTKWPLLFVWRPSFQSKVLVATGYADLNLSTSVAGVTRLCSEAGLQVEQTLPAWHSKLAKLLVWPTGHFVVLRKPGG